MPISVREEEHGQRKDPGSLGYAGRGRQASGRGPGFNRAMISMLSHANPALFGGVIPMQQRQPAAPIIAPGQAQADITGMWGAPTMMPQMNPIPMYDTSTDPLFSPMPFSWGPYFGGLGGFK